MSKRTGFTLAETLTVILIIMVLMAVTMPALMKALRAPIRTVCISNIKQLYLAMKLYEADYGEYPRDVLGTSFVPYYPVNLRCPSSPWLKFERNADYAMIGALVPHNPNERDMPSTVAEFQRCRELRGPLMPVVVDQNHVPPVLDESDHDSDHFILVGREGGSITRSGVQVMINAMNGSGPCDKNKIFMDYNF